MDYPVQYFHVESPTVRHSAIVCGFGVDHLLRRVPLMDVHEELVSIRVLPNIFLCELTTLNRPLVFC